MSQDWLLAMAGERERPEFVMMNFTEFHSNYKYKIYKNKKSNNILSTTWTGITLLPGALGAQVLDLLGP